MELIYIWIRKYKILKNFGYTVSAGYTVENKIPDHNKFELTVGPDENNIDDLIYGTDVSVNGIVGENGSGKSTLLEVLKIVTDSVKNDNFSGFAVYRDKSEYVFKKYNFDAEVAINSQKCKECKDGNLKTGVIYYSDKPDLLFEENKSSDNYIDSSFAGEMKRIYNESNGDNSSKTDYINLMKIYRNRTFWTQLTEIKHLKNSKNGYFMPVRLDVKANFTYSKDLNKNTFIENAREYLENYYRDRTDERYQRVKDVLLSVLGYLSDTAEKENTGVSKTKNINTDQIRNHKNPFNEIKTEVYFNDQYFCKCDLFKLSESAGTELNDTDTDLISESGIELSWPLSTGEHNIFTMITKVSGALNKVISNRTDNVIILLDEVENSMHPNWCQNIVKSVSSMAAKRKLDDTENVKVNIIFASHSPIILSDIPKKNVLFVKKGKTEERKNETFAANIASLYYDSFFMKEGSIGVAAKTAVNNLIYAIRFINETEEYKSVIKKWNDEKEKSVSQPQKESSGSDLKDIILKRTLSKAILERYAEYSYGKNNQEILVYLFVFKHFILKYLDIKRSFTGDNVKLFVSGNDSYTDTITADIRNSFKKVFDELRNEEKEYINYDEEILRLCGGSEDRKLTNDESNLISVIIFSNVNIQKEISSIVNDNNVYFQKIILLIDNIGESIISENLKMQIRKLKSTPNHLRQIISDSQLNNKEIDNIIQLLNERRPKQ